MSGVFLGIRAVFLHDPGIPLEGTNLSSTVCPSSEAPRGAQAWKGESIVTSCENWDTWVLEILFLQPGTAGGAAQGVPAPPAPLSWARWTLWMRSTKGWVSSSFLPPSPLTSLQPSQDATKGEERVKIQRVPQLKNISNLAHISSLFMMHIPSSHSPLTLSCLCVSLGKVLVMF